MTASKDGSSLGIRYVFQVRSRDDGGGTLWILGPSPRQSPSSIAHWAELSLGYLKVTKPYEFIGFGALDVTKPYEFIGFGTRNCRALCLGT